MTRTKHAAVRIPVGAILLVVIFLSCSTLVLAQAPADPDSGPPRWSGVTVIDGAGWQYRNVELVWVGRGQALQVTRSDGATRTFAPTDLRSVLDATGADITAAVVSRRYDAGQPAFVGSAPVDTPESKSGYNEIGATATIKPQTISELIAPRLFTFAFDLGAGFGGPVGDWYLGMDSGILFAAGARIRTGGNAYVHLVFRTRGLGTISAYDYGIDAPITVKSRVSEYLFLVGGHARLVEGSAVRSTGYIEAGGGMLRNSYDLDYVGRASGSLNKFGFAAQGGILLLLSDEVALDLCGSLNYKPGFLSNESMGMLLGLQVGLMYYR